MKPCDQPGRPCSDSVATGTRDAFHAPCVAVTLPNSSFSPGDRVVFTDTSGKNLRKTKKGEYWHGVIDPLLEEDDLTAKTIWLFLRPNSTEKLRHHFDVPFLDEKSEIERLKAQIAELEERVEEYEYEDDGCRGCY